MKLNRYGALVLLMAAVAQNAVAKWGTEQLKAAQVAALDKFRQQKGDTAYSNVFAFGIEKNTQETAGMVKITYKETGAKKEISYFCHEHERELDSDIDCHPENQTQEEIN